MAGDKGSRRFVRDWWVLVAFMLGAVLGALASNSNAIGVYLTLWVVIGVGVPLLAVSVMFAHLEERRRITRPVRRTPRNATEFSAPSSKVSLKGKPTGTRGQLHAISGKKTTPSTGSSGS